MAVDMFLKLDGIDGESTDKGHKNEIEIESFSWGASNSGSAAHGGGGGGAGKASFQDFSFTTRVSKASPRLFLACASGEHIKSALLTVRKAGGQQQDFLKVTMSGLLVSSYKAEGASGADAAVPVDQVSLNFAKIQVAYAPQRPDGTLDREVTAGWDLQKNVKI
ncbi:MAG: Hcp family type VI secretion system effector [Acidimicrobiales bacterium]